MDFLKNNVLNFLDTYIVVIQKYILRLHILKYLGLGFMMSAVQKRSSKCTKWRFVDNHCGILSTLQFQPFKIKSQRGKTLLMKIYCSYMSINAEGEIWKPISLSFLTLYPVFLPVRSRIGLAGQNNQGGRRGTCIISTFLDVLK